MGSHGNRDRARQATVVLAFVLILVGTLAFSLTAAAQTQPPEVASLLVKLVPGLSASEQAAVIIKRAPGRRESHCPVQRFGNRVLSSAGLFTGAR
jgi:hypothetical protein